jgi:hypothetical protein
LIGGFIVFNGFQTIARVAEHDGLPEILTEDLRHDRLYGTARVGLCIPVPIV